MEAVRISNVTKKFGAFEALQNVSLSVDFGERVVICGPSGSGKSTLIRCINQLEVHNSGVVMVLGRSIAGENNTTNEIRREVGMVFQHFNLFPHLTVLQNCTLALLRVKRLSKQDARQIALANLERVKIPEQANKYPSEISGGQKQRVAIARALSMKPKIMLFDEPTSALDPEMIKEVLDVMIELSDDGMTSICVTHEMSFAKRTADRIVFMDEGRILEEAAPAEFFTKAQSKRAREFLEKIL